MDVNHRIPQKIPLSRDPWVIFVYSYAPKEPRWSEVKNAKNVWCVIK